MHCYCRPKRQKEGGGDSGVFSVLAGQTMARPLAHWLQLGVQCMCVWLCLLVCVCAIQLGRAQCMRSIIEHRRKGKRSRLREWIDILSISICITMDNLSLPLPLLLSLVFHLPLAMLGILENAAWWRGEGRSSMGTRAGCFIGHLAAYSYVRAWDNGTVEIGCCWCWRRSWRRRRQGKPGSVRTRKATVNANRC